MKIEALRWVGDAHGTLRLLDQTQLPGRTAELEVGDVDALIAAIRALVVRGAPAIGIAGAYGAVLAARARPDDPAAGLQEALPRLQAARPTAVNLGWALARVAARARAHGGAPSALPELLLDEARTIHAEDAALCLAMARAGAPLLQNARRVLTHCHTGALATGGIGTALGVIRHAREQGAAFDVLVDETRPLLQGARLTAWELRELGIPCTVIPDSAAAGAILRHDVDAVLVGADRIAANGDTANKVGTLALALAAHAAEVPFFVVAPSTSFDLGLESGEAIPIEERDGAELGFYLRDGVLPGGVATASPAFDVTPAHLITALVCERGVLERPNANSIKALLAGGR